MKASSTFHLTLFFAKETKIFAFEPRTSRILRQVFDTLELKTSPQNKRGKKQTRAAEGAAELSETLTLQDKSCMFSKSTNASSWLCFLRRKTSSSRGTLDLMGDRLRRRTGVGKTRGGGGALSGGRKRELLATKPSDFLIQLEFQEWIPSLHIARFFCFFSRWFSAISMHPTATRADCCRLHTVIGTCFWLGRERKAAAFQGKMCKGSLTLHQRGLPRGPPNITVFMTATTQGREKPFCCKKSITGGDFLFLESKRAAFGNGVKLFILNLRHF